jgi:hypothetical protein
MSQVFFVFVMNQLRLPPEGVLDGMSRDHPDLLKKPCAFIEYCQYKNLVFEDVLKMLAAAVS